MKSIENKIKKIISKNFEISEKSLNILYIEHSILDRNHVYIFNIKNKNYIIKISFSLENWTNETKVLDILKKYSFVPQVIFKEKESEFNYVIMESIDGTAAIKKIKNFDKKTKDIFIYNLGLNLAKIHSFKEFNFYGSWEEYGEKNLIKHRKNKDINMINRIEKNSLRHNKIIKEGLNILESERNKLLNFKPKLTHKDFSLRNILADKTGKITGVLDYEHSEPEDPSLDICSIFHSDLLDEKHNFQIFKKGYEEILEFPYNFLNNKKYYLANTGIYLCGRFSSENTDIHSRGLTLIKKSINL